MSRERLFPPPADWAGASRRFMGELLKIEQVLLQLLVDDPDNEANAAHLLEIQNWIAHPELMSADYHEAVAAHHAPGDTDTTDGSTLNFLE